MGEREREREKEGRKERKKGKKEGKKERRKERRKERKEGRKEERKKKEGTNYLWGEKGRRRNIPPRDPFQHVGLISPSISSFVFPLFLPSNEQDCCNHMLIYGAFNCTADLVLILIYMPYVHYLLD